MTTIAIETIGQRLARRLRDARVAAGLTVREAASRVGINHSLLVRYENGTMPSLERLDLLAQCYGLTVAALFARADERVQAIAALDATDTERAI